MKTKLAYLITSIFLASCATPPKGNYTLAPMIALDIKEQNLKQDQGGRPVFAKIYLYPRLLENGDLFAGGYVFLNIGREKISYKDLLENTKKGE